MSRRNLCPQTARMPADTSQGGNAMFEILVTSSFLIIMLALLRKLWKRRLSPVLQYALWLLVAVRLLVPIPVFGNAFSIMNFVDMGDGQDTSQGKEGSILDYIYTPEEALMTGKAVVPENAWQRITAKEKSSGVAAETAVKEGKSLHGAFEESPEAEDQKEGAVKTRDPSFLGSTFSAVKWARYLWYGGIAVMAIGMLVCNILFYRRLCRERRFLCRRGNICIYEAKNLDSPCLYGLLHPAVYLTRDCLLSDRCREHAITHELTHYRHGDHIWILVRNLCALLYWFDPFVWLALYLAARDCELACDAGTIHRLGEEQREAYGHTLIEMASPVVFRKRFLRCVADLTSGKKELKERITAIVDGKKKIGLPALLSLLCAALLAACSFGSGKEENKRGGYVESVIELPASGVFADMVQGEGIIRLTDYYGGDYISEDGGKVFLEAEPILQAIRTPEDGIYQMKGGADGSRIFLRNYADKEWMLVTSGGELKKLELPTEGQNFYPQFYYGAGYFYTKNAFSVYRTDAATGDTNLVWESEGVYPVSLAADEKLLYIVTLDGLVLYDLERQEIAPQQDEALAAFLGGRKDILLYPCGTGIYVVAHEGIFWHELYGDTVECLMEGEMYGLGNRNRELVEIAVLEAEGKGAKEAFLVYCSDGTLLRYDYDEELVPLQNVLRVYSVYEDGNIRRAVTAFRDKYPDIPIKYEVGISLGYGKTLDDALKNLSTELAAGNGPDILVMDDIPYSSYVEKGVLSDLSSVREQMAEEDFFVSVIDAVGREFSDKKELYMVPLTFVVPVLAGDGDAIQGVRSLTELGDLVEEAGTAGKSVLGFVNATEALSLLAQSSMGAWVSVEGTIDRAALTEYMSQAKRIYDIQMQGVPDELKGRLVGSPYEVETILTRRFGEYGMGGAGCAVRNKFTFFPGQSYYAGYLGEDYAYFNGCLKIDEAEYQLMPGQNYGACIPVSLVAVNSAAREESLLFLEYALSEEFQGDASLKGLPINKSAYRKMQENPNGEELLYANVGVSLEGGGEESREIYWPDETDFEKLDGIIDSITSVNLCEDKIYEEVIKQGEKLLSGSISVEEAVDAVESALKLYIAE